MGGNLQNYGALDAMQANCLKMEGKNRANNQAAKREAGLRDLVGILSCKHESVMRGCFLDILCLHNQRFKPSALAVLRREIVRRERCRPFFSRSTSRSDITL